MLVFSIFFTTSWNNNQEKSFWLDVHCDIDAFQMSKINVCLAQNSEVPLCFVMMFVQVNDLVLSVQSAQGKQQDEVDSLHAVLQDAQTQLQSSRSQCKLLAVELETARKAVTTAK